MRPLLYGGKSLVTTLVQSESEDCSITLLQRCVQSARKEGDHMMRELETRSAASAFDSDDQSDVTVVTLGNRMHRWRRTFVQIGRFVAA